jgi:hypothetical protein
MMVHMFFLSSVFLSEQFNMQKKTTIVVVDTGQRHPNESQDEGKGH